MPRSLKYNGRPCKKDPNHIVDGRSLRYFSSRHCVSCLFAAMKTKREPSLSRARVKLKGRGIFLLDEER